MAGLALLLSMVVGCNSGKQLQRDLYQRELRLQEDEIYRLEDYIEQYQGIIREYRCRNAELEQQLSGGTAAGNSSSKLKKLDDLEERSVLDQTGASGSSSSLDSEADRPARRPASAADELTPPQPPRISGGEPADPPGFDIPEINMGEPAGPADVSAPEAAVPEIDIPEPTDTGGAIEAVPSSRYDLPTPTPATELLPPPSSGTSSREAPPFRSASTGREGRLRAPAELPPHPASIEPLSQPAQEQRLASDTAETLAVLETLQEPQANQGPTHSTFAPANYSFDDDTAFDESLGPPPIVIESESLEIQARQLPRHSTGEQQILVTVIPRSIRGEILDFVGSASLMLRDPRVDLQIARWDYSMQEVKNAWSSNDDGLNFVLILPGGVPQSRPLELWARLLDGSDSDDGSKKLLENISIRIAELEPIRLETLQASEQSTQEQAARLDADQVDQSDWSSVQQSQQIIPTTWEAPAEPSGSRVLIKQEVPK